MSDRGETTVGERPQTVEVKLAPEARELNNLNTYIILVTEAIEKALPIKERLVLPEGEFLRKKEFHVTALGFGTKDEIKEMVEATSERGENLIQKINEILSAIDFSFTIDLNSVRFVHNKDYDANAVLTKTGRAAFESEYTITIDVNMPGMNEFYDRMREEVGLDLGQPATHVTLYIKQNGPATGMGIAITDLEGQIRGDVLPRIECKSLSPNILK